MKSVVAAMLLVGSFAMAQGSAPAAAPAAPAEKKVSAKEACKDVKGKKEHKACIKEHSSK